MFKYFTTKIETLEELRKEYKRLSMKYHPDRGGTTEDMQGVNAEYEKLLQMVGAKRRTAEGETWEKKDYDWTLDRFREVLEKVLQLDVTVEICGSWLWVFGGFSCKDILKEIGFFWCSGKKAWAWSDEPKKSKHKMTLDEIRDAYGSEIIKQQTGRNLIEGVA